MTTPLPPNPAYTRFAATAQRVNDMLACQIARLDSELEITREILEKISLKKTALARADVAYAVCMGHHHRLGGDPKCHIASLPADLLPIMLLL